MKKILGLDLGTNSIGWALIESDFKSKTGNILGIGSRIIPMSQDILGKFESGNSVSQTAERTGYRGVRRLYQKDNLRRERLHRVLNILGFLPRHYAEAIDFEEKLGQFIEGKEVKINYTPNGHGKHEFIFKDSFNEMAKEFKTNGVNEKIPYDWTLYFLRKKALTQKISKEELAWVILNFNQKRGYYQARGEEESIDQTKLEEFYALKVTNVESTEDKNAKGIWYNVILENGWVYRRQSKEPLDQWIGITKEFIITTSLDKDGNPQKDKEGDIKRSFRAVDSEKDWIAIKKKTEKDIDNSRKTVGEFIYETLLTNPRQKIRGKLIKTIERKFYKDELSRILKAQSNYHNELQDQELYNACVEELYPRNEAHRNSIKEKDFHNLFLNDIVFYQRPLKSKKSSISNCAYETRSYKKTIDFVENGQKIKKTVLVNEPIKAIPKSHPFYQEFRLWQFISNIKILQKERIIENKTAIDVDVTYDLFSKEEEWIELYDFLNEKKEIEQKQLIDYLVKKRLITKREKENFRWNYVEDKKYPCNTTNAQFISRLSKVDGVDAKEFLTSDVLLHLWHIVYSVKDKHEFEQALSTFASKYNIELESFVENFKKIPPFDSEYGAYSLKAIKKLLPIMRRGKYWKEDDIPFDVQNRAEAIKERLQEIDFKKEKINEEVADDDIPKQMLKSFIDFKNKNILSGLNTYQACYLVYGRHSEASDIAFWKKPEDIVKYLDEFKQHSLRNPIVEQVVTETLRVVKDIWDYYGEGKENFFDEIHIELGREMKNPADKRKQLSQRISENENTNYRIKELLKEIKNDSSINGDVRPHSPSHQEILKIYEEGIFQDPEANYSVVNQDEIEKIRKKPLLTKSEIVRYKLWLEQGYISPYTGRVIPLSDLFTTDYQIEHVIPQARYFDDSLGNKIICESEVNELKSNKTAYEFIKSERGRVVQLSGGRNVKLLSIDAYEAHCNRYFKRNRIKLKNLLSEDIPEGFINRQLNDSRYISKFIKGLLSNVVRSENEQAATSKNIIPVSGAITSKLKQDWGLNDKWNEIIVPRFKRMNELTGSEDFGFWDSDINAFRTQVPDTLSKGFNKKRIDHRHHALDALIIACTDRRHIQYLNALNAEKENYALRELLLKKSRNGDFTKVFLLPWSEFPVKALDALERTVVSFKQNLRIINKTNNKTWQWVENDGVLKKKLVKQTKGDSWAIRKPMHKETISGSVRIKIKKTVSFANGIKDWENLVDKKLKNIVKQLNQKNYDRRAVTKYFKNNPYKKEGKVVSKVEIYDYTKDATASRIALSDKFSRKQLESVTDSGIRKILENHIKRYRDAKGKEHFDLAFNPEGINELNRDIQCLNNGKPHQPIYKVRVYEEGSKFNVGYTGNKKNKFVEAAKGTNLFFAVYWNEENKKREFETIPLNVVIEHQKWRATLSKDEMDVTPVIPINKSKGIFLFFLSPNDLVYLPAEDEIENPDRVDFSNLTKEQTNRMYKMVSSTGNECHFVQCYIASLIKTYDAKSKIGELGSLNKLETSMDGIRIKEFCWKLKVDRLGNVYL